MAKIRHIAIMTENQAQLAEFYKNSFDMKEVHRHASQEEEVGGEAIYLSDGNINLAILPAGGRPEGIHHFGFQVDDVEATAKRTQAGGARQAPKATPRDGRFAEAFIVDPAGTRVDLSRQGWKV